MKRRKNRTIGRQIAMPAGSVGGSPRGTRGVLDHAKQASRRIDRVAEQPLGRAPQRDSQEQFLGGRSIGDLANSS
jgi:hypothetical protein